jgi:glucan phosphoethanolaminetransferase (alkaline phosphatase superfamily)
MFAMRVYKHFLYSVILSCIFIFSDIIFSFFISDYWEISLKLLKEWIGIFILSFMILSIPSLKVKKIFIFLFTFFSFIQMAHYLFFHGYLMHYEIMFFFTEFDEISESISGVLQYMFIALVVWFIQLYFAFKIVEKSIHETIVLKYVSFVLIIVMILVPFSAYKRHNISSMMPRKTSLSMINVYNAISLFIGRELPKYFTHKKNIVFFKPYIVQDNNITLPQTVIVVMGESLSYKHMDIFTKQEYITTPFLDQIKEDPKFFYKKGYASGVTTLMAVPTFFLLKREPENTFLMAKQDTNLLKLAKKHGYKVSYITTQKLNIMATYDTKADFVKHIDGKDEELINTLEKIDFSKKNFIVLHQRNSHSPYENSTPERFYKYPYKGMDYHTYMLNSYRNSILYTDYILGTLIQKVQKLPNSIIFITSDHGEMMGSKEEGGRYGHVFLSREVAKVPIMIYDNTKTKMIEKSYKSQLCHNHYTLGKIIANTLGFVIDNPNENGKFYIQGALAIDGSDGFIEYSEEECINLNKQSDD